MHEQHEHEQYFFDQETVAYLTQRLMRYENPCCLCCPMLGRALAEQNHHVHILDIDQRFADLPGFLYYDIYNPTWLNEQFDIIICDPPFFNVSLSQLFSALRLLSRHNLKQELAIAYLKRRESAILGTFAKFNLAATDYRPGYVTVQKNKRNEIEFYSNGNLFK